ncbi:unnamed protein product, partial [Laminaria digitata]
KARKVETYPEHGPKWTCKGEGKGENTPEKGRLRGPSKIKQARHPPKMQDFFHKDKKGKIKEYNMEIHGKIPL